MSGVKPVEIISFLEISPVQMEVLPSHKLQDHVYEYQNLFILKEDNLSWRNCQNQLNHPGLSHTEQECQESLIQGKILNQRRAQIFVRLSFRELCDSNLSGLDSFDNMTIIH